LKPIKEVSESELLKQKVSNIFGFVRSGNLPMVNGIINHYKLGQAVMTLRGFQEEFAISKTEKVSMAEWNPFLVAVAFKRLDIVRYFV